MDEDFYSIRGWILDALGPNATDPIKIYDQVKGQLNKVAEEVHEFRCELKQPSRSIDRLAMEAADIYISLVGVCTRANIDLPEYTTRKMEVNRARKWNIRSDGSAQHIDESLYLDGGFDE